MYYSFHHVLCSDDEYACKTSPWIFPLTTSSLPSSDIELFPLQYGPNNQTEKGAKVLKKQTKYITKWCYLLGVPLVTSKHPLKHSPRARILQRASGVDTFNTVWQPPATSGLLGGERIETSTCQHLLTSAHARVRPRAGVDKVRTEENELKKSTHVYLFSSLYLGLKSVN